ncbi:proline dehydrogenase family protein [Mycetocola saprophilus]|uniref:proline dehydrogenase family protein n=1 Tax=Mycetocola saprophilus TaxID=76636 RepID=UPI003BF287ED
MADRTPATDTDYDRLARESVALAREWVLRAANAPIRPEAARAEALHGDPGALALVTHLLDDVVRPEGGFVAGAALAALNVPTPAGPPVPAQPAGTDAAPVVEPVPSLTTRQRTALRVGALLGPGLPALTLPSVRKLTRELTEHLVIEAPDAELRERFAAIRTQGVQLGALPMGAAVLGDDGAARALDRLSALAHRDDVDRVSVRVGDLITDASPWAFDPALETITGRVAALISSATRTAGTLVELVVEDYRELDLTQAVVIRLLADPALRAYPLSIALPVSLPDVLESVTALSDHASARVAAGGAPLGIRLSAGDRVPDERVTATLTGWPVASYPTVQEAEANLFRVLSWVCTPERMHALRVCVSVPNLFDLAFTLLLAAERGVSDALEYALPLGVLPRYTGLLQTVLGRLTLLTPVVAEKHLADAGEYLVRTLREFEDDGFLGASSHLVADPVLLDRETERFRAAVRQLRTERRHLPEPRRTQNRESEWSVEPRAESVQLITDQPETPDSFNLPTEALTRTPVEEAGMTEQVLRLSRHAQPESPFDSVRIFDSTTIAPTVQTAHGAPGFGLAPDTDPSLAANRAWANRIRARALESTLGTETSEAATIRNPEEIAVVLADAARAASTVVLRAAADRAALSRRIGFALAANRDRLLEIAVHETGTLLPDADREVSDAIDLAHYYAATARELDTLRGARFAAPGVILVAGFSASPIADPAAGVIAALAVGAVVVLHPAAHARRSAAVLAESLWEAGVSRDQLRLVTVTDAETERALVIHPVISRVLLRGDHAAAERYLDWKPDLDLRAELPGKNTIIVMPSADLDQAVAQIVSDAFGRAGQLRESASLVVVVGSAARSEHFRHQLVDATSSLVSGATESAATTLAPLASPATPVLATALADLPGAQSWLLEPLPLPEDGRNWRPGIREGIENGAEFQRQIIQGPTLGIMRATTLREALRYVNATGGGRQAALHTRDAEDLSEWLERIDAGSLHVNRPMTDLRVQRQPGAAHGAARRGPGAAPGGPNHLIALGDWVPDAGTSSSTLHLRGLDSRIRGLIEAAQPTLSYDRFDLLRRAALSDAIAWGTGYGAIQDASELGIERNLLRYRSVPVAIRAGENAELGEVLRVIIAAMRAKSAFTVSLAAGVPAGVRQALGGLGVVMSIESDAEWIVRFLGVDTPPSRVRLVGPLRADLRTELIRVAGTAAPSVYAGEVTASGRVELLHYLREQSISIAAHRFGRPDNWSDDIL